MSAVPRTPPCLHAPLCEVSPAAGMPHQCQHPAAHVSIHSLADIGQLLTTIDQPHLHTRHAKVMQNADDNGRGKSKKDRDLKVAAKRGVHAFWAVLTRWVATTKASLTAGFMWGTRSAVVARMARASSRNGGFCPVSSAIEDPTMLHCTSACNAKRTLWSISSSQHQS